MVAHLDSADRTSKVNFGDDLLGPAHLKLRQVRPLFIPHVFQRQKVSGIAGYDLPLHVLLLGDLGRSGFVADDANLIAVRKAIGRRDDDAVLRRKSRSQFNLPP